MPLRVIIVGLIFATAASLGLVAYQLGGRSPPRPASVAQVAPIAPVLAAYLVASHPLPPGTLIRADDITARTVPIAKLPENAMIDSPEARADLRSSLVRRYVEPGAPVTTADFMRPRDRGFLAAVLTPDTRAVSIGVNPVSGVAGLIWPGDHVDVILTQVIDQAQGRNPHLVTSETILSNVRVLAVDQDIAQGAPPNSTSAGRAASTVTVQATTDQAERLAVATRLGQLSLAVRSINDARAATGVAVSGIDVSTALSQASALSGSRVQIIQGGERGEVTFR